MQVAYFARKLIEHDPADVGVKSRVMMTLILTPRLLINACFDKVKIILMATFFTIFLNVFVKFAQTFTAVRKKHSLVLYFMCLQKGSIRIKGEDSPSMAANQDDGSAGRKIVWMEGCFSSLKNFSQLFADTIGVDWKPRIR